MHEILLKKKKSFKTCLLFFLSPSYSDIRHKYKLTRAKGLPMESL